MSVGILNTDVTFQISNKILFKEYFGDALIISSLEKTIQNAAVVNF